ncbi:inter-alpha-trypsin inhibitor heavy chain H3-like isoform 3-T3 [Discoglossus pictus]
MECIKWFNIIFGLTFGLCALHASHGTKEDTSMEIHSLHVDCKITSRFARTLIMTELRNTLNVSREAIFDVELPKTAFITNFSMTIGNITNVGIVKEKDEAKQQYQKAVSKGQSAGLVQSTGRKMEHFKISVNIAAFATATFNLTYEELLKRYLGNYELYLRVKPKHLVQNFQINVDIYEPQGISSLNAQSVFITNDLIDVVKTEVTNTQANIVFKPSLDQQRTCPTCAQTLIDGDFIIKYDVKRDLSAGNIQIVNGYFVHYFAPATLKKVPKNVVFVIDHSGSMYGTKIKQTYEAFSKILDDVPAEDYFGILIFDDKVEQWKTTLVKALPKNINNAKTYVSRITARGGTNINGAILAAVTMLKEAKTNKVLPEISTSIILFLSDGEPTSGITNNNEILNNVKRAVEGQSTLYCLGFGSDVDYNFLEKLALENGGLARRIYEDSDSALQLQGFYNEVAYPLLLDVHLQYLDNAVTDLTRSSFRHYYQGSELIVAGHICNNDLDILKAEVTAQGESEQFLMKVEQNVIEVNETLKEQKYIFGDFTERLWAYLSIEQLLTQQISAEGEEKKRVTEKALNLSLKYNFVTPLTSMVVTTSEDDEADKKLVANKPKEGMPEQAEADGHYYGHHDLNIYDDDSLPDHDVSHTFHEASHTYHDVSHTVHDVSHTDHDVSHTDIYDLSETAFLSRIILLKPAFSYFHTFASTKSASPTSTSTESASPTSTSTVCSHYQILISVPTVTDTICLKINRQNITMVNLLHDAKTDITINGELVQNTNIGDVIFGKIGFVNKKRNLSVEMSTENIIVTHNGDTKTYGWTSSFEEHGFLKKDEGKITVSVENSLQIIISLKTQPDHLILFVQEKHLTSRDVTGLVGQLLSDGTLHIDSGYLNVNGIQIPVSRANQCGIEGDGLCQSITMEIDGVNSKANYSVSNIFDIPHVVSTD